MEYKGLKVSNLVNSLQDSQPNKTWEPGVLISVVKDRLIFVFSFLMDFSRFHSPWGKDEDGSEHPAVMSKCSQPPAALC